MHLVQYTYLFIPNVVNGISSIEIPHLFSQNSTLEHHTKLLSNCSKFSLMNSNTCKGPFAIKFKIYASHGNYLNEYLKN